MSERGIPAAGGAGGFPRTIWMFWRQGWENAPELVRRCRRSWEYHNPGWTIRLLDGDTWRSEVDLSDISPAPDEDLITVSFSNLLRFGLLKTHGGVWADATCFCRRPLDDWISHFLGSGFFSFERDGWPMYWFLASAPGDPVMDRWYSAARDYWAGCSPQLRRSLDLKQPRRIDAVLHRARMLERRWAVDRRGDWLLKKLGEWLWRNPGANLSPLFRNILRSAPFFWTHYLFRVNYERDAQVRRIWDSTPKFRTAGLLELGRGPGLYAPLSDSARWAIDERHDPVFKLNWRLDLSRAGPGSHLDYLFSTVPDDGEGDTARQGDAAGTKA